MSREEAAPRTWYAAAWRILAAFTAAVLLWLYISYGAPLGQEYDRRTHAVRAVLTSVLAVPLVVLAWRSLNRRPWAELGLPASRTGLRHLLLGTACWAVPAALGFALCWGTGWSRISALVPGWQAVGVAGLLVVLVLLLEALPEELVFRGYILRNLLAVLRPWQAVLVQAALFALFGLLIGAAESPDRLVVFFVFALVLGAFRVATGDIWAGIGFHLAFQTVSQLFTSEEAVFEATDADALALLALGGLPFVLGWTAMAYLRRGRTDWQTREP